MSEKQPKLEMRCEHCGGRLGMNVAPTAELLAKVWTQSLGANLGLLARYLDLPKDALPPENAEPEDILRFMGRLTAAARKRWRGPGGAR